jgi:light-regulated signal transduction histidine kinase (bacteriophytochrome)
LNADLATRAAQLETANRELEAFSYSASHDLRSPLRHIDAFCGMLHEHAADSLDHKGRRYLAVIADSARQMGQLIDDLLAFSRMARTELHRRAIDLDQLVQDAIDSLEHETKGRNIIWQRHPLPQVEADPAMLRQALVNLISNAIKYSRPRDPARIEIGCAGDTPDSLVVFIRDNGVGFDMRFADKLFGVFQRLHRLDEFEGTGIGLANVQRIIQRHQGRVWAESKEGQGAAFYFSLPKVSAAHPS